MSTKDKTANVISSSNSKRLSIKTPSVISPNDSKSLNIINENLTKFTKVSDEPYSNKDTSLPTRDIERPSRPWPRR